MAKYTFTDPSTGKQFSVSAPEGATYEQAEAVFQKQLDTGSLLGLKPGSSLNAVSQLTGGLTAAVSQVTQAATGIAGSVSGVIQGALNKTNLSASGLPGGLTGIAGSVTSVASQTLSGITKAASGFTSPTAGIGLADFAKQGPALASLPGMNLSQVTATLSQASKIVGQASGAISNTLGVGKFGLDGPQLEAAGMLKPGTVSSLLSSGTNSLTSVLKSPTVWTGKDGIKGLDGLLSNTSAQNKIQENLMSNGLAGVKELGIPTDKLNPTALSGLALNAAKSIPDTLSWAKGAALPPGVKDAFDQTAADGSFAVAFADTKVDDAMKQLTVPEIGVDTADRVLVDAASKRIVGNNKIPESAYI